MNPLSGTIALVLAATPPAAVGSAGESAQVTSLWDFVMKGGFMMIPIGICSLVGLAVIIERLVSLRRGTVIPADFLPGLKKLLTSSGDKAKAMRYCEEADSPVSHVFLAGIKRLGSPIEVVEKQIADAGEREVLKLRKFVRALSVLAAITPLMGLLGTILGMIKAFQTVALSADALGRAEMLAGGIYEAMITTAAGLTVAIPVLVAYHWISSKVEKLVMDIDQMTVDFVEEFADSHATGEGLRPASAASRPESTPARTASPAKTGVNQVTPERGAA